MKRIAVITGASSGMGKRFAETVDRYGTFDEVWVIARHEAQLEALRATVPFPVRVLALDLTDRGSFDVYAAALAETPVEVGLLMNCSGYGKFSAVLDTPLAVNLNMTDLNCQAVVAMCQITAPYMPRGSQIINIASVAAFQPIPYIDIYGATKAFVLSFSRALNRELKSRGIGVMAVCPFWTKTAFFDRAIKSDRDAHCEEIRGHVRSGRHCSTHLAGRQAGQGRVQVRFCGAGTGRTDEAAAPQRGHGCMDEAAGPALTQKTTFGIAAEGRFLCLHERPGKGAGAVFLFRVHERVIVAPRWRSVNAST